MLMSGNVVAAMVPPPQSLMLKEKGFRELVSVKQFREWNIPVVENGVAARRSFIDKNPNVAKRFIRAAFEGDPDDLHEQGTGYESLWRNTPKSTTRKFSTRVTGSQSKRSVKKA